jgi:hypothetical protein
VAALLGSSSVIFDHTLWRNMAVCNVCSNLAALSLLNGGGV